MVAREEDKRVLRKRNWGEKKTKLSPVDQVMKE